jgi:hypothetical protein
MTIHTVIAVRNPEQFEFVTLLHISQILLTGGEFNGKSFPPHTGVTDLHVMIVSHGALLSSLISLANYPVTAREPPHNEGGKGRHGKISFQYFGSAEIMSCKVEYLVTEDRKTGGENEEEGVRLREVGGLMRGRRVLYRERNRKILGS